jgi:glycosyltransferase involved in cell wall biosynthesis
MQKTTFSFEFIIGEDFSTDGTRETVFEYAKMYPDIIRVFTADYNVGAKANGRRCMRASRGKYMALCEGDDYWICPYKLQKQVDLMEENCLALCVHSADRLNTDSQIKTKHSLPKSGFVSTDEIISQNGGFFATGSYMFRKDAILPLPDWFFLIAPVGDYYLTILASIKGPVYYLKESMCVYRVLSTGSWSAKYKSLEWHDKFYYRQIQSLNEFNKMTEQKYDKAITSQKKQLLADNIRAYTKFDKIKALKMLMMNFFNITFMNKIVILNRILFK